MPDFNWWTPIPWLIALVSIVIALLAYRRTRYPNVQMSVKCPGYFQGGGESDFHGHLYVDLLSRGADVYAVRVCLECVEVIWVRKYRSRWIPRLPMWIQHSYEFTPSAGEFGARFFSANPNPLKNGQSVRFRMTDHHLRETALAYPYFRLPSEYWPGRVRIAVYHSGGRLLKKRKAWWFRRSLVSFDLGALEAVGRLPRPALNSPKNDLTSELRSSDLEDGQINLQEMEFLHPELNVPPADSSLPRSKEDTHNDA